MIDGVDVETKGSATVCRIKYFSDALADAIRSNLSAICHGPEAKKRHQIIASYKETLKEFNRRYKTKGELIQKGMIGELLTHVLLLYNYPDFHPVSPFFNMEEASIKKGFDLVLFDQTSKEVWLSEVKSGAAQEKEADAFNKILLERAKNDLKERLTNNEPSLWLNAINGASAALASGDIKNRVDNILERGFEEASGNTQVSNSKNVILISVVYKGVDDPVSLAQAENKHKGVAADNCFRDVIVFSIQKQTYQRIAKFLESEAHGE